ncbi:two component transcriptional regulator, LuxR family [Coriobacterium glomerans PW2]|uniref:Two component transcriptional regulator, LuxR family n=1 Tax=Coriobacterium glomerans (strain ATCC 49209 / DSM 20642 / JCM 10262 / PW2) TaxID=700015 RepID=F2NAA4_CORGP|nr:response regulator transcription factor [Coriobacterium glomerans]AEB06290.1 two component transcriptional regulator, LuxR family [Coriobacterium glomerans PW2]
MKIVIADDDRQVCDALRVILEAQNDIEVVGTGLDGDDAIRLFGELGPDIVLMDIQMPGRDGLSAAESILYATPNARIVFLTTFSDEEYIVRALRAGARGYLIKQDVASIPPALRAVMQGQSVLEGEVLEHISLLQVPDRADSRRTESASRRASTDGAASARPAPFGALSDREFEVVLGIARGLDNREIAAAAYMGEGTVRNHISMILAKLHLKSRTQIAIAYWRAR